MKFFKSPIFEVQAREVKILSSSCQPSPPHYPCSEMVEFSSNLFPTQETDIYRVLSFGQIKTLFISSGEESAN